MGIELNSWSARIRWRWDAERIVGGWREEDAAEISTYIQRCIW